MSVFKAKNIDILILCGGMGTRLKSVANGRPKPMAAIGEKPFLDILIQHTAEFGFGRFILCAGYKAESIQEYYSTRKIPDLEIVILKEKELLGTGGAVKNAEELIQSSPFLILNGDSFFNIDLHRFIDFHITKKALLSVALISTKDSKDYGSIEIDNLGKVVRFSEKEKAGRHSLINAGIYLFNSEVLSLMPSNKRFSLEYDFFPKIIGREFYGYLANGFFIDIGTPERYEKAKQLLKDLPYLKNCS
jgi:D-glycero-alpha-D-manno-heptose 1-phosphate guanylyltransferase